MLSALPGRAGRSARWEVRGRPEGTLLLVEFGDARLPLLGVLGSGSVRSGQPETRSTILDVRALGLVAGGLARPCGAVQVSFTLPPARRLALRSATAAAAARP